MNSRQPIFDDDELFYANIVDTLTKQTLLLHDQIIALLQAMGQIDPLSKTGPTQLVTLGVALERLQTLYMVSINSQISFYAHSIKALSLE